MITSVIWTILTLDKSVSRSEVLRLSQPLLLSVSFLGFKTDLWILTSDMYSLTNLVTNQLVLNLRNFYRAQGLVTRTPPLSRPSFGRPSARQRGEDILSQSISEYHTDELQWYERTHPAASMSHRTQGVTTLAAVVRRAPHWSTMTGCS